MTPPSSFVMTTVAERGVVSPSRCGHWLGLPSPGCWMLTNIVRWSGVVTTPVTSQPGTPVRNRRSCGTPASSVRYGLAASIWSLAPSGWVPSVWIQTRPSGSDQMPSGDPKASSSAMVDPSPLPRPWPASRKRSHSKDVAVWSLPFSLHRMTWPHGLGLRGLAALITFAELVLLVSVR